MDNFDILNNLDLAVKLANKFRRKGGTFSHYELEDWESEGYVFLIQASQRYDIKRGVPFRLYASDYICNSFRDLIKSRKRLNKGHGILELEYDNWYDKEFKLVIDNGYTTFEDWEYLQYLLKKCKNDRRGVRGKAGTSDRVMFRLYSSYWLGLSCPEIGKIEGVSGRAVDGSLRHVIKKLKMIHEEEENSLLS